MSPEERQADFRDRVTKSARMTLAERRPQLEGHTKAMTSLKGNGPTAQDYLVGVPALHMALMAAQGLVSYRRYHS